MHCTQLLHIDDVHGCCRVDDITDYVTRCAWLDQYTLTLSLYDSRGCGTLTEHDLNAYIDSVIDSVPCLARMEHSFRPFYKCTCTRKFFFMLDTARLDQVGVVRSRQYRRCCRCASTTSSSVAFSKTSSK